MGLLSALTAVLRLETGQFKRKSKEATRDIRGVGSGAESAGRSGSASFLQMAGALTAVTAAVGTAITRLNQMSVAAQKAGADASAAAQQRQFGAAGAVNTQSIRALQDVTPGLSGVQALQGGLRAAAKFGLESAEDALAIQTVAGIRAAGDPAQRAGLERAALTFAGGRGVSGEGAAGLLGVITGTFGITDQAGVEQAFAGVGAGAQLSDITPTGIADILTRTGGGLVSSGLTLEQGTVLAARIAPFIGGRSEIGATTVKRILALRLSKTPFVKQAIAEGGGNPETEDPIEILDSLGNFVRANPRNAARLKDEGTLPRELIEGIEQATSGIGIAAGKQVAGAIAGANFNTERGLLKTRTDEFTSQVRSGQFRQQAGAIQGTGPGTRGEAAGIRAIIGGNLADVKGFEDELTEFSVETNVKQGGFFDSDDPLAQEQLRELFTLNRTYPGVIAALSKIEKLGGDIAIVAQKKALALELGRDLANRTKFIGTQSEELPRYKNAMDSAIQFIRQVGLGQRVTGRVFTAPSTARLPGQVANDSRGIDLIPSAEAQKAAAGITVGDVQILNINRGTETNTNTKRTKTTQPSP